MSIYVVVQLKFVDRAAYDRYQSRFMDVMRAFRGKLLAADEHPEVLEGDWPHEKVVLMSFPDRAAFMEWSESPAYREISKDRKAGAHAIALLIKGIELG